MNGLNEKTIKLLILYLDDKYSFSPESLDWSQSGSSISNSSNNSFCKICFNKNSLFKINFTDSFLICTNKEVNNMINLKHKN